MEGKINNEQRIDDYILGRMSSEEKSSFENDMNKDEALRKEYESEKLISEGVVSVHLRELAAKAEEEYQVQLTEDVDKYLRNEMSSEEKAAFELRMEDNPAVKERYELQALVNEGVQRNHLRELAKAAEKRYQTGRNLFRRVTYGVAIAASLAIVAIGGISGLQFRSALTEGRMLMSSLPEPLVAMGAGDEVGDLIATAQEQMKSGDNKEAAVTLDKAMSTANENLDEINARIDKDDYVQQTEELQIYMEDIEWCQAVNLMEWGKYHQAKKALKSIVLADGTYAESAQKALDSMKLF